MTDIQKCVSEEQLIKEKRNAYMREYNKNRRLNDEIFRKKRNEGSGIYIKNRYIEDEDFKQRIKNTSSNYYNKFKKGYLDNLTVITN